VIEQPDIDERQRVAQAVRDDLIGLAWLGNSRRMIVGEYDGRGAMAQRLSDDLARVYAGAIDRAAKELLKSGQTVAVVEIKAAEHFVRTISQSRHEKIARGAWTRERRRGLELLLVVPPGDLQRRLQLCVACTAQPACAQEPLWLGGKQGAQSSEVPQQIARKLDRVTPAEALTQEDTKELCFG
jgi:hypothetical protein